MEIAGWIYTLLATGWLSVVAAIKARHYGQLFKNKLIRKALITTSFLLIAGGLLSIVFFFMEGKTAVEYDPAIGIVIFGGSLINPFSYQRNRRNWP